jgi:hypothetical protein
VELSAAAAAAVAADLPPAVGQALRALMEQYRAGFGGFATGMGEMSRCWRAGEAPAPRVLPGGDDALTRMATAKALGALTALCVAGVVPLASVV